MPAESSVPTMNAICHECLSQFDDWWEAVDNEHGPFPTSRKDLAKRAFVAGFQGGGRYAVEIMHAETKRIFKP